jgi:hypothetical protein
LFWFVFAFPQCCIELYSNLTKEGQILNVVSTMKMNLFPDLVLAFRVQGLELIFLGKGGSVHT